MHEELEELEQKFQLVDELRSRVWVAEQESGFGRDWRSYTVVGDTADLYASGEGEATGHFEGRQKIQAWKLEIGTEMEDPK